MVRVELSRLSFYNENKFPQIKDLTRNAPRVFLVSRRPSLSLSALSIDYNAELFRLSPQPGFLFFFGRVTFNFSHSLHPRLFPDKSVVSSRTDLWFRCTVCTFICPSCPVRFKCPVKVSCPTVRIHHSPPGQSAPGQLYGPVERCETSEPISVSGSDISGGNQTETCHFFTVRNHQYNHIFWCSLLNVFHNSVVHFSLALSYQECQYSISDSAKELWSRESIARNWTKLRQVSSVSPNVPVHPLFRLI